MYQEPQSARIFPNVRLGAGVVLGPWVVIGQPPRGVAPGELETVIEDGSCIRSHTVIYAGCRIGPNFQSGHHAVLGAGVETGANCSVGTYSVLLGYCRLGDGAKVHGHCCIGPFSELNERAWIGPSCSVDSGPDKITVIAAQAILGLRVQVAPGIRVGERALVGTRSRLVEDVPPYRLVVGNPARAMQTIDRLVSPYEIVGRPYDPDPADVQAEVLARHQHRNGEASRETWRHQLWRRLGSPQEYL
jgi:acetyltransferase-like isoleucine patch superfamily enzyme